ncbi:MAG: DUF192 domain-containing protein [Candidatus Parcubacteria bacterium]|nr:DUF192 domain-containing protein [Candidatus Parcubacteria bacterium]
MKYVKYITYIIIIILVITMIFLFINEAQTQKPLVMSVVEINNQQISVEIAKTTAEQAKGLGLRSSLAADSGMLFRFKEKQIRFFWMKDMEFPLDIIWIADNKIVGIAAEVAAPIPGQDNLPSYSSGMPVSDVLEVNAGYCASHNIKTGDLVTLKLK